MSTIPLSAVPTAPVLHLDSANVKQEGLVEFSVLFAESSTLSDFPAIRFNVGETGDQAFRLYIDLGSIQTITFNAFTLSAYLVDERENPPKTYKYDVTGNPTGNFRDEATRVVFHIKSGNGSSDGWISMPVYSAVKSNLLVVPTQKSPFPASVSKSNPIQLLLQNLPDTLTVQVTEVSAQSPCSWCWTQIKSPVTEKNPLNIDGGSSVPLEIDFLAKSVPALLHSALIIQPDKPHDTVTLTVTYHTEPGGADRKQMIPVEIRFTPTFWALALVLACGILLGLGARYLLTGKLGQTDNETAFHAILFAIVFVTIAEFVGVLMTSYGESKLVLFGIDLDPRQVFPAFVLAILVSGGPAVVSWVRGFLGK
jgi:hypothetical protein